jgi:hypothetical protein
MHACPVWHSFWRLPSAGSTSEDCLPDPALRRRRIDFLWYVCARKDNTSDAESRRVPLRSWGFAVS